MRSLKLLLRLRRGFNGSGDARLIGDANITVDNGRMAWMGVAGPAPTTIGRPELNRSLDGGRGPGGKSGTGGGNSILGRAELSIDLERSIRVFALSLSRLLNVRQTDWALSLSDRYGSRIDEVWVRPNRFRRDD